MGIALFALSSWFAPLQAAASRFAPAQTQRHGLVDRPGTAAPGKSAGRTLRRTVAANNAGATADTLARPSGTARRPPALRVVRTIEAGIPAGHSGRMVISGRMSDVCAELDRLATLESTRRGTAR